MMNEAEIFKFIPSRSLCMHLEHHCSCVQLVTNEVCGDSLGELLHTIRYWKLQSETRHYNQIKPSTLYMTIREIDHISSSLQWRHNGHDGVSNHQPHQCLLNRLYGRRSKKTSKLRVTGLCVGNSPRTGEYPHKWPVTRKMFPFDDVIMLSPNLMTIITFLALNLSEKT